MKKGSEEENGWWKKMLKRKSKEDVSGEEERSREVKQKGCVQSKSRGEINEEKVKRNDEDRTELQWARTFLPAHL